MFSGPDRELKIIYSVLVNGSMILTAYFGWTLAEGVIPLQIVLALLFAAISRAVGGMFLRAAEYRARGAYADWIRCLVIGTLFAAGNIITDYGSAAAIRDMNTVRATNINTEARDARREVQRLETRIAEIRNQTAWKTTYLAPDAYDGLIRAARLIRDNESKRGGCGPLCEQKTKELETLNADKANAVHRLALKAEMVQLERELVEAKAKSAETQMTSSAALAQVKSVVSWFTGTRNSDETSMFWGNQSIVLWGAIFVTLGIIYLASEIGSHVAPVAATEPRRAPIALPAEPTPLDPQEAAQRAADRHSRMEVYRETTTIEKQTADRNKQLWDSLEAFEESISKARQQLA